MRRGQNGSIRPKERSSDEDTVSVSKKGQVKSKQYGSATITATVEGYGDLSVDIDVPDPSDQ